MKKTKLFACLAAGVITLGMLPALSASAATEERLVGYRGDINGDMQVDLSDVLLLMQHLTAVETLPDEAHADKADMDRSGTIDARDLTLLKRAAMGISEPEGIYETVEIEEQTIDAPVNAVNPTLTSKGEARLLMMIVEFPDYKFKQQYSAEDIRKIAFGESDPDSRYYPQESVRGYYERASYGALTMEADIYTYTMPRESEYYVRVYSNGKRYGDTAKLADAVMSAFDDQIDFNRYDGNGDHVMDTLVISVADTAPDDGWWPCSNDYFGNQRYDGVSPGNVIVGNCSPSNPADYNKTWIHELGHAMGLPDYYKYENVQDGYYGLNGPAGTEMMDDAVGDMCAFSKLMYGWYTPSQIQVYEGGTQTYTLRSSQTAGNCVVIPRGDLNGYLSEFFILEYATLEGNNAIWWVFDSQKEGGLRVLHAEASVSNGNWGPEFSWSNYAKYYDSSNQKQRVLRLVNEKEGGKFFTAGDQVTSSLSGFHWYDGSGYQTVDPQVKITVDSVADGVLTVTVSQG